MNLEYKNRHDKCPLESGKYDRTMVPTDGWTSNRDEESQNPPEGPRDWTQTTRSPDTVVVEEDNKMALLIDIAVPEERQE